MFTPVFSNASPWGIYLFFALINLLAIPFAYFFYPETAGRQLEEIDLIFAKAHVEGKWPFQVAQTMPKLSYEEITSMAADLGLALREEHSEKMEIAMDEGDSQEKKTTTIDVP